jgi:hypothetical protein
MSQADEAARVVAPVEQGSFNLNITTASQRFEIPASFGGMQCTALFRPDTAGSEYGVIVFGDSAVTATLNTENTVSTEVITLNDTAGLKCPEDVPVPFVMPSQIPSDAPTHFAIIGSVAGHMSITRG